MDSSHVDLSCDAVCSSASARTQPSPRSSNISESGLTCPLVTQSAETDRAHNVDVSAMACHTNGESAMSLASVKPLLDETKQPPSFVPRQLPTDLDDIAHVPQDAHDSTNPDNRSDYVTAAIHSSYASLSPNLNFVTSYTSEPAVTDTFALPFACVTTTTNPSTVLTSVATTLTPCLTNDPTTVTQNSDLPPVIFTQDSMFPLSDSSNVSNAVASTSNMLTSFVTVPDSVDMPRPTADPPSPAPPSNPSVTNFDQQALFSSGAQLSYLPASIASAPLPKSFPFTLMPISPNGDFPAVQLTLPDLPAVILQVLPLPGAKMGEQYTINVPTPLILSGINSALANGGTMNGGPIMLSIAPSGTLPQSCPNISSTNLNPNEVSSSCPQDISSGYGTTTSNLTLFNIPVPSSSNLSAISLSSPQLGIQTASNCITKRMRAIAPKPCFNFPSTSLNGSSSTATASVSKVSQSRSSSKKCTTGSALTTPVSSVSSTVITPNATMPSASKHNKLSILPLGSSRSNRGRRKINTTINTSSCPTCVPTPVFLTTSHTCSVSAPGFTPFNDMFLGSGTPVQSANFTSQPLLMPNATAPIMSGSVLQSGQLPPGFLLGGSFPPGSNPSGATPYIIPGPFSFPNGCPSFPTATVYNNNNNNNNNNNMSSCPTSTAGIAPMPPSSTNPTLFSTGAPSGLTAVDPTTGLVTHYPQCIPMAMPYTTDGSSSNDQAAPFGLSIVYSQPNPNALGFLLPNVSQPNPLVYPVSGQSIISNMPPPSSSLSSFEHHQSTPDNLLPNGPNTLSYSAPSSMLGSMVSAPTSLLTTTMDSSNSLISVYSAPLMTVDANSMCPAPITQQLPSGTEQHDDSPLAKDDLISIAWRLTQMDDVLDGEQHVTQSETSDVIGDGGLFGTLFQPYDAEKSTGYEFGMDDLPGCAEVCDTTEVVLLDKDPVPDTLPAPTAPLFPTSTESTGNADIDALLAAAAMVGAASGVGDAQSAVTVPVPSSFSTITVPDVRSQQSRTSELLTECAPSSASELIVSSQQSIALPLSTCTSVTSNVPTDLLTQDPLSTRNPVELLPNTLFDDFNDAACRETSDVMASFDETVEPTSLVAVLSCSAEDAAELESVLCPDSHNLNDSGPVTESFLNSLVGPPELVGLDDPDADAHLFDTADFDVCPDPSSPTPPEEEEEQQQQQQQQKQNQPESDALADVDIVVSQSLDSLHADNLTLDYETFARSAPSVMDTEERPVPSSHQVRSLFQNTLPYRFGPANMALTSEENSVFTNLFETNPSKLRENRPFRFPVDVTEDFLGVDFSDAAGDYTTAEQFNEALMLLGPPPTSPHCSSNVSELSLKDTDFISTNGDAEIGADTEKQPIVSSHLSDFIEASVAEQQALNEQSPTQLTSPCVDYEAVLPTSKHSELLDSILNVGETSNSFDPVKSSITSEEVDKLCDLPPHESSYSEKHAVTLSSPSVVVESDQLLASPSHHVNDFDGDETLAMRLDQAESQRTAFSPPDVSDEAHHRGITRSLSPSRASSPENHPCPEFALPDEAVASTPAEKRVKRRQGRARAKIPKQDTVESLHSRKKSSQTSDSTVPSSNSDSSGAPLSVEVAAAFSGPENPTILNVLASSSALLEAAVGDLESDSDVSPVKSIEGLATLDRMLKSCQRRSQQGYQSSESKSSLSTEATTSSHLSDVGVNQPSSDASTEPLVSGAIPAEQTNGQRSYSTSEESSCDARGTLPATFSFPSAQPFQTLSQAPFERPHSFGFSVDTPGPELGRTLLHSLPGGDFKDHLPRLNLAVPGKLFADYVSSSPEADDRVQDEPTVSRLSVPEEDATVSASPPIRTTLTPSARGRPSAMHRPKRNGKAGRKPRRARRAPKESPADPHGASILAVSVVAQFPPVPPVPTSAAPFSKFAEAADLPSFATVQSASQPKPGPCVSSESEDWSGKSSRGTVLFEDFIRTHSKESEHPFASVSVDGADGSECAENTSFDTASLRTGDGGAGGGGGSVSSHSSTCPSRSNSLLSSNLPITVCCGFSAPAFYTLHNSNASISGVTSLSSTPNNNSLSPSNASRFSTNFVSPGAGPSSSSTGLLSGLAPPTFASYGLWAPPSSSVDSSAPSGSLLSVASTSVAGITFGSFAGAAAFRSTSFSALAAKAEHVLLSGSEKTLWSTEKLSFSDLAKVDASFTAKPQSPTPAFPSTVRLFDNATSKPELESDLNANGIGTSDSCVTLPATESPKVAVDAPSVGVVSSTPVRIHSTRPRRKRSRRGRRPTHGSLCKRRSTETVLPPSEVIPTESTPPTSPLTRGIDPSSPLRDCLTTRSVSSAPSPEQPQGEKTPVSDVFFETAADQHTQSPTVDVSALSEQPGPVTNQMYANGVCYEVVDVSAFADSSNLEMLDDEPGDPNPSVTSAEPDDAGVVSSSPAADIATSQNLEHSTPPVSRPASSKHTPNPVSCPSSDTHQSVAQDSATADDNVQFETCHSTDPTASPGMASPAPALTADNAAVVVSDSAPTSQPPIRLRLNLKPLRSVRNRNGKKREKTAVTRSAIAPPASNELVPVLRIKRRQDAASATAWDHSTSRVEQVVAPPPPIKLYRKSNTQFVVSQTNSTSVPNDEREPQLNQPAAKPLPVPKSAMINKLTLRRTPLPVSAIVAGRFSSTFVHSSRLSTVFSKKIFSTAKQDRRSSYAQMSRPWRTGFAGSPRKRGLPKSSCPKSSAHGTGPVQPASTTDPVRPVSLVRGGTGRRRGRPPTRIRFGRGRLPEMSEITHQSLRSDRSDDARAIRLVIRLGKRPSSSAHSTISRSANTLAALVPETDLCVVSDTSSVSNRTPPDSDAGSPRPESPRRRNGGDALERCAFQFCVATEAETFMDPNQVQIQRTVNRAVAAQLGPRSVITYFPPPGGDDDDDTGGGGNGGGAEALPDHHNSSFGTSRLCERYSILPSVGSSQSLCPRVKTPGVRVEDCMQQLTAANPVTRSFLDSSMLANGYPEDSHTRGATAMTFPHRPSNNTSSSRDAPDSVSRHELSSPHSWRSGIGTETHGFGSPSTTGKLGPDHSHSRLHPDDQPTPLHQSSTATCPPHPAEGRSSSSTSSVVSVPPLLPSTDSPAPPSLGFTLDNNPLDVSNNSTTTAYPMEDVPCYPRHPRDSQLEPNTRPPTHLTTRDMGYTGNRESGTAYCTSAKSPRASARSASSAPYQSDPCRPTPLTEPVPSSSSVQHHALALAAAAAYATFDPMMARNPHAKAYYDQWASSIFGSCWPAGGRTVPPTIGDSVVMPEPAAVLHRPADWTGPGDHRDLEDRGPRFAEPWTWANPHPAHSSDSTSSQFMRKHPAVVVEREPSDFQRFTPGGPSESVRVGANVGAPGYANTTDVSRYSAQPFAEEYGRLSSNLLMDYGRAASLPQHKPQLNGW